MKRKILAIVSIVLAVLIAAAAGVLIWQWDNIQAVQLASSYSQEDLQVQRAENQQRIDEAVEALPDVTVRDLTDEEKELLASGEMDSEELVRALVQGPAATPAPEQTAAQPTESSGGTDTVSGGSQSGGETQPVSSPQPETEPQQPTYEEQLAEQIARLYVLRASFSGQLDNLAASAKEAYKTSGYAAASEYISVAYALEDACDAQVAAIVSDISDLLAENGGDLSLVDTINATYVNEKNLVKATYIAQIRGMA